MMKQERRRRTGGVAAGALVAAVALAAWLPLLGCQGTCGLGQETEAPARGGEAFSRSGGEPPRRTGAEARAARASVETRHPRAERIVAIGDLHGDLTVTNEALRLAGVVDAQGRWVGGETVLVQTGDQLDRGDGDRAIVDLFRRLRTEAKKAGGRVIPLNGNHEMLNVRGRFGTYVTAGGFRAFRGVAGLELSRPEVQKYPSHARARAAAFLPGGPYAQVLAERPVVAVVGENVFVHGGLLPKHVEHGVDRINRQTARWMRGEAPFPEVLSDRQSPVWLRRYSLGADAEGCRRASRALEELGAKRMIVGHTVQTHINSACGGRVWRIDVGMSSHYGGPVQALEIRDGEPTVLGRKHGEKKRPRMPRYRQAR